MQIDTSKIPFNAIKACRMLKENGFEAYLVGGCVRDLLLDIDSKDYDITTNATPDQVKQIFSSKESKFPSFFPKGEEFGTIVVKLGPNELTDWFEVTTYRSEGRYVEGRKPEEVKFETDVNKDLERRDLTINAIAYDPINDQIIDPYGGIKDLNNKIIKAVGDPNQRFEEDGLRTMRAARFAARYNFELDPKTKEAIKNNLSTLSKVSKERYQDELNKTLKTNDASRGVQLLFDLGPLEIINKKLFDNLKLNNNIPKLNSCGSHLPAKQSVLLYGLSLIDIEEVLRDLKFKKDDIKKINIISLALQQLKAGKPNSEILSNVKNYIKTSGVQLKYEEALIEIVTAAKALGLSKAESLMTEKSVIGKNELKITGNDLIGLGLSPGPNIKKIIDALYADVLAGGSNEKVILLEKAKKMIEEINQSQEKKAKIKRRTRMLKLSSFWELSDEDKKRELGYTYDLGPLGRFQVGDLPHIKDMINVPAGPEEHHPELNQAIHNRMVYEQARKLSDNPKDWFAAVTHDLGKVHTDPQIWPKQHKHEGLGVEPASDLARQLGAPTDWEELARLVAENHLKGHTFEQLTPKTRKALFEALKNKENVDSFITAIQADQKGRLGKEETMHPHTDLIRSEYQRFLNPEPIVTKPKLNITTQELISELGIKGPEIGKILKKLNEFIEQYPTLNNKEDLLDLAKKELIKT